jgi:hypothetical protein
VTAHSGDCTIASGPIARYRSAMNNLLGPILVAAGFGLYMLANVWLGQFRRMPYGFIALSTAGALYSVVRAFAVPSTERTVFALVSLALLGGVYWFFFSFSMYAAREDRPRVGDLFPSFELPASDGALYDSASARGRRQLLIFYRGSW